MKAYTLEIRYTGKPADRIQVYAASACEARKKAKEIIARWWGNIFGKTTLKFIKGVRA